MIECIVTFSVMAWNISEWEEVKCYECRSTYSVEYRCDRPIRSLEIGGREFWEVAE